MNKKLYPAFLLTFVNVIGLSIMMPVLPFVVSDHNAPKWVYGLMLTLYSVFQFMASPWLGRLSDRHGRKPILILSHTGTMLSWVLFGLAFFIPEIPLWGLALPLWLVGFSRITDGLTGGNTSVANAYVADLTTHKEKSYIFGYLGGITGIGMIIGPALGGLSSSGSIGFLGTALLAGGISLVTLVSIFFWLEESLPVDKRRQYQEEMDQNPGLQKPRVSFLKSFLLPLTIMNLEAPPLLKLLLHVKGFIAMMMAFYISTIALFIIDTFQFTEKELGFFMFIVGAFLAFNQAIVSKKFIAKFGELNTLKLGLGFSFFGLFCITLTNDLIVFVMFYYIMNLGISLIMPTFGALIAQNAPPQKQGEIMGISESINSLSMAIFPILAASLYGFFGSHLYYGVSALPAIALIILLWKLPKLKEHG